MNGGEYRETAGAEQGFHVKSQSWPDPEGSSGESIMPQSMPLGQGSCASGFHSQSLVLRQREW